MTNLSGRNWSPTLRTLSTKMAPELSKKPEKAFTEAKQTDICEAFREVRS